MDLDDDENIWIGNYGDRIPIDQMSDRHMRNTLKLIMRRAREGYNWRISPKTKGLRFFYDRSEP